MDDQTYAARLRNVVRAEDLRSELNAHDVLQGARRSRRRAATLRTAGALALTLGVAIGVGPLIENTGAFQDVHVADREQAERDATVEEVLPGVHATVETGVRTLEDGSQGFPLGLTAAALTDAREIGVVLNDGANRATMQVAPWRDNAFEIALLDGAQIAQRQYWDAWASHAPLTAREVEYWTASGGPEPDPLDQRFHRGQPPDLAADEGWAMAWPFDDDTWFVVGYLPASVDPTWRARVLLRDPITGPDGLEVTTLELPTFDAGSSDGRRMFAATIDPGVGLPTPNDGTLTFPLERVPVTAGPPAEE